MTDCRLDGRRSLAAFKKGLLNSKNYVSMGLDVVPGAEEQVAVRVLRHWVEAQEFCSGGRSVDQMTELTAHWVFRACCAFLILVAAGIQMSQWRPQAAQVARGTIKLCSCLLVLSIAVPGLKLTFLVMPACLCRAFADFYSRAQGFNDVFGIHASSVHIDPRWSVAMAAAYDEATLRAAAGAACVKEVYEYQASKSSCVPILDQQEFLSVSPTNTQLVVVAHAWYIA